MERNATSSTQENHSERNRARVLQHLYHSSVASRAQIAKALSLTPAAITKITARMLDEGLITEVGAIEGARNRRSIGLSIDTSAFRVIGVKFARSLIHIGLFDLAGTPERSWTRAASGADLDETVERLRSLVRDILASHDDVIAVGMAVPGPYLRDAGHTAVVSSMQEWRTVNFRREFEHAFDVPVFIEQDARAGALAQYLFDPRPDNEHLAYYLLGEGVGLGVIEHGETIDGARGAATEVGHISIDCEGRPCECGNRGCLERYCSAVAIHETLDEAGDIVPDSASMTHLEACEALFARAAAGDARALGLVRRIGTVVGYGCVTVINAFNPSRVVIGDIVAGAGEPLLEAVRAVVAERVLPELARSTAISLSRLPADAAVTGAAAVAITRFLEHPSWFSVPARRAATADD